MDRLERIKQLINAAFPPHIAEEIKITKSGIIQFKDKNFVKMYLTPKKPNSDDFIFLNFTKNIVLDDLNICIRTFEFDYSKLKKNEFISLFDDSYERYKYAEIIPIRKFNFNYPELEYDNYIQIKNISEIIFGEAVIGNSTDKIFIENNGVIDIIHSQLVELDKDYNNVNGYFDLKYSGDKDIWNDDILKKSIQQNIKHFTNIEFDLDDITSDNIKEIGKQVQIIFY